MYAKMYATAALSSLVHDVVAVIVILVDILQSCADQCPEDEVCKN